MRTFVGVIVAIATLGLQFVLGLVPAGNSGWRFAALILGQCGGFGLLAAGYIWHAAWEDHNEILSRLSSARADNEEYARMQAAHTLYKITLRLLQSLNSCHNATPLAAVGGCLEFKTEYEWYLLTMNDSFVTPQRHELDPLPLETTSYIIHKELERAIRSHANWLRDYSAKLNAELTARARTS